MALNTERQTLAYLGPEGTFTHEAALDIKASNSRYGNMVLQAGLSITEVCEMVVNRLTHSAVTPIENSTDGPIPDALEAFRRLPLHISGEVVYPIRQSFYYQRGTALEDIELVISKDSALGQVKGTVKKIAPNAQLEKRDSTVLAIKEAAERSRVAAIGPIMAAKVQGLSEVLDQIDDVHDNPLNATRFLIVDSEDDGSPATGYDKTSLIAQLPDKPGSLYAALDTFVKQGINLAKIKSFGIDGDIVSFFMSLQGHQSELPLDTALRQLTQISVNAKMLGSYPQASYQPAEIPQEVAMKYSLDQLKKDISNGINGQDKTVAVFTLQDRVGALRNALEPFARRRINLTEIDSLPTGRLGEYIFYLSFNNGVGHKEQALDELATHCTRMVLL